MKKSYLERPTPQGYSGGGGAASWVVSKLSVLLVGCLISLPLVVGFVFLALKKGPSPYSIFPASVGGDLPLLKEELNSVYSKIASRFSRTDRASQTVEGIYLKGLIISNWKSLALVNRTSLRKGERGYVRVASQYMIVECTDIQTDHVGIKTDEGISQVLRMSGNTL